MNKLVAFDLETGGLDAARNPVIQFAAVACTWPALEEVGSLELKVAFDEVDADADALKINGYDADAWKREAVPRRVAVESIAGFFRSHSTVEMTSKGGKPYRVAKLVGHNALAFDAKFLRAMFRSEGAFLPGAFLPLDTLALADWLSYGRPGRPDNLKLGTLVDHFGIKLEGDEHEALRDARAVVAVLRRMRTGIRWIDEA